MKIRKKYNLLLSAILFGCASNTGSTASIAEQVTIHMDQELLSSLQTDADSYSTYLNENNADDFTSIAVNEDGSIDLIQTEEQNTGYLKTYRETLDQAIAAYTASSSNQLNEITVSDDYSTVTAVLDGTAESQQDISVCTMMAVYAEIGQIYSGIAEEDIRIYVKIQNNSHIVIDQIIFPDDISE